MSITLTIIFMILGIGVWDIICKIRKMAIAMTLVELERKRAKLAQESRAVNKNTRRYK